MRVWTITELLTSRALFVEGREMQHCVATYTDLCVSRQASIWSMQMMNRRGQRRVLTIDVDMPTKEIFEVRGKCNRMPSAGERAIVERWAAVEGLKVGEAL